MASYIAKADLVINVYQNVGESDHFGFDSIYASKAHPGTNKIIEGWKWDEDFWPGLVELRTELSIPSTFDGSFFDTSESDWQSGIGSGDDCKLKGFSHLDRNDRYRRLPILNHGTFFLNDQEYYLLGDGASWERIPVVLDSGNFQYYTLDYIPKATIPVRIYNYIIDRERGDYDIYREFKKKQYFTPVISSGVAQTTESSGIFNYNNINSTEPEFVIRYSDTDLPPTVYLNGDYSYGNEADVTLSGLLGSFEIMGISTGAEDQVFYTNYSPLVPSGSVSVYTYNDVNSPTQWTVITGVGSGFTGQAVYECILDEDLGTLTFGDYDPVNTVGSGYRPTFGDYVAIQYSGCHWVAYESEEAEDTYTGRLADTTVIYDESSNGFVHLTKGVDYPLSLTLEADLDSINDVIYGPLDIGKNFAKLIATVHGTGETPLVGHDVVFEISEPSFGSFNNNTTATVSSDANGRAITYYNPPTSIDDFGYATDSYSVAGGYTTITVPDSSLPSDDDYVYLYTVAKTDYVEGIPASGVNSYYENYFSDEGISYDAFGAEVTEEQTFRDYWDLITPPTYEEDDIETGSKKIVMTYDSTALDPQTGNFGTYTALQPTSWSSTNSGVNFIYSGNLTLDSTDRSFYLIYPSNIEVTARVYNSHLKRWINSNTITINLDIPDSMSGLYFASDLSNLPSGLLKRQMNHNEFINYRDSLINYVGGDETDDEFISSDWQDLYEKEKWGAETVRQWFNRTYFSNTSQLGVVDVTSNVTGSGVIPLGFRITGANQTAASVLNAATFLNLSDNVYNPNYVLIDDFKEAPTATGDQYIEYAAHYSRIKYQNHTSYRKYWYLDNDASGSYVQIDAFIIGWTTFTYAGFYAASWVYKSDATFPYLKFRAYTSVAAPDGNPHYAGFAAQMPDHQDLSDITHLVFRAKGAGTLTVGFETQNLVDAYGYGWYGHDVTLASNWTTYRIALEDLDPSEGLTTWTDGNTTVNNLVFYATDGNDVTEVYIDNIVLEGKNLINFVENN